jgi:Homeodomain-like domain-containing protein
MIDQTTRSAILRLRSEGHGTRAIATALGISRGAVKRVLAAGSDQVPHLERAELAEPHRDDILSLYASCKGNLVRVHEELGARGATLSYPALTAFCRRHGIGHGRPLHPQAAELFVPTRPPRDR